MACDILYTGIFRMKTSKLPFPSAPSPFFFPNVFVSVIVFDLFRSLSSLRNPALSLFLFCKRWVTFGYFDRKEKER